MARFVLAVLSLFALAAAQLPIQGLDEGIGRGFDLKYGKIGAPVFDLTYNEGHVWTNPLNKKQWLVPDQMVVTNNPTTLEVDELIAIKTHEDYIHLQEKWHSTSVFLFFFGYNDMKETGTIDQLLSNGTNQVYLWNRDFSTYSLSMWPQSAIPESSHPKFTASLERLPETCDDLTPFNQFLGLFGTHYISKARFGGRIQYNIAVAESLTQKHSSSWVHKQTSMWVAYQNFKLGLGGGKTVDEGDIDSEYKSYMNYTVDHWGGETTMEEDGYSEWAETVTYNPAMLYPEYRVITELIPAGAKRDCVWKALHSYLNTDGGPLPEPDTFEGLQSPSVAAASEVPAFKVVQPPKPAAAKPAAAPKAARPSRAGLGIRLN